MEHTCLFCKRLFDSNRPNVKYCCPAHRLYAHRERHGVITKKEKEYSVCQREGCTNEIPDESRSDAMYCSNACNQAVYNKKHAVKLSEARASERARRKKAKEKAEKRKQIKQAEKESSNFADKWMKEKS